MRKCRPKIAGNFVQSLLCFVNIDMLNFVTQKALIKAFISHLCLERIFG